MPDSVGGVDAILGRLRDKAWGTRRPEYFKYGDGTVGGHSIPCDAVPFADAEVAVHAAADAGRAEQTQEIVDWLRADPVEVVRVQAADLLARRFPNGGTNDSAGA